MRACKAEGVREAVCTMWQDDGAETPMAAGLPSIVLFAEHGFSREPDRECLKEQFEFLTGSSFDAYLALGEFDAAPGSETFDNPSKYLLYQDVMMGLFDGQVKEADGSMKAGGAAESCLERIMSGFGRSCRGWREVRRPLRMRCWSCIFIWRMCFP